MLKLTVAIVAFALAGTAGAAGWKSLKVDGSSDEAFAQSLAVFKDKLSAARALVFRQALQDIWDQGVKAAEAAQGEYTTAAYYRQLNGLGYEDIVNFTDPSGETAHERWRVASLNARARLRPTTVHLPRDTWDQGAASRMGPDNARAISPW